MSLREITGCLLLGCGAQTVLNAIADPPVSGREFAVFVLVRAVALTVCLAFFGVTALVREGEG